MYALEAIFAIISLAFLVSQSTRRASRRTREIFFACGVLVAILTFAFGQARIHFAPALLVFLLSSVLLLRHAYSHAALRAIGVFLGSILIFVSVFLAVALPVVELPEPDGPNSVGVTSFTLIDESRTDAVFGAPDEAREIYVQVWYPGSPNDAGPLPRARTLWQELYPSAIGKVIFGYLGGMKTHSLPDVPVAAAQERFPAIVFSPSLGGIAEQNTLLMEHLASHGYIVYAVTHPHFGLVTAQSTRDALPMSNKLMPAQIEQGAVDLDAISARARLASDPVEQAGVWLEYFERAETLNEFVEIWVRDLTFLLDSIVMRSPDQSPSVPLRDRVDVDRIGLLGMSFGGGAMTELCKTDTRCRAVMNMDGGLWGEHMRQPLTVPYLVLASRGNRLLFEHDLLSSRAPYYALTVEGAAHSNFTDVSAFLPIFEWLGITGAIDGDRVIDIMNATAQRFFDVYLRDTAISALVFEDFPEIEEQSNRFP
jgi:predicted dienelactone hydrolase